MNTRLTPPATTQKEVRDAAARNILIPDSETSSEISSTVPLSNAPIYQQSPMDDYRMPSAQGPSASRMLPPANQMLPSSNQQQTPAPGSSWHYDLRRDQVSFRLSIRENLGP
jgi:hypothetical protein